MATTKVMIRHPCLNQQARCMATGFYGVVFAVTTYADDRDPTYYIKSDGLKSEVRPTAERDVQIRDRATHEDNLPECWAGSIY